MTDFVAVNQAENEQNENYDTSEPEQVNKARKKAARTRADRLRFIAAAMEHEEGRAWFNDLLIRCHVFHTPFVQDSANSTAFRCGEHNIGLMVLSDIQDAAPDKYLIMVQEGKYRKSKD